MSSSPRQALLAALATLGVLAYLTLPTPALANFGVTEFTAKALNQNGTLDTQAGSHPFQATTSFTFNQHAGSEYPADTTGNVKDIQVELPPGFIGNPRATPTCTEAAFNAARLSDEGPCPVDTQVGTATVSLGGLYRGTETVPVYNLAPSFGHTAELGFSVIKDEVPTQIVATVNPAAGYRIATVVRDIPTGSEISGYTPLLGASLTLWGVPADPAHDPERGQVCNQLQTFGHGCEHGGQTSDSPSTAFLTNPTSCPTGQLATILRVDSWQSPGHYLTYTASSPQATGCNELSFNPSIVVEPETTEADTPGGYTFRVKVSQDSNPYSLATPELDTAKVTLPRRVSINPSAANGLQGCTDAQIAIGTEDPIGCPPGSKIGTAEVFTPLLADGPNGAAPLDGAIYLGTPLPGDEYRVFLAIEGDAVSIRLQGSVSADPVTGQITATFAENPPLPFSELVLRFFSGSKAALANPLGCGPATTTSQLTPYSSPETPDGTPASTFQTTNCANPAPFTPVLTAGSAPSTAGAYTTFTLQLTRGDRQQYISQIAATSLPPGLAGNLSSAPLCDTRNAAAGSCPAASQIGQVTVGAGPGATPFYLGGKVYLTEGYADDPYGLAIVVPAIAGPYDLGTVVVRAGIEVDPRTAAVTVQADPLPTILEGIPLRLRFIGVTLERPRFIVNPTDCAQQSIGATVFSQQGETANLASPFFAAGCAGLRFSPVLLASTQGSAASGGRGASLDVRVAQAAGEADIKTVHVELPKLLPARLSTLNRSCPEATFAADAADCKLGAIVGSAEADTPLLPVPLKGPVYFVSHGGAAFPELVLVLHGYGLTIDLGGETHIDNKTGVTSSTFKTVPDVPITSFELRLPEQSNSALASGAKKGGNLCAKQLVMPTRIEAQNGAIVKQETPIAVTGCKKAKKTTKLKTKKAHHPTRGAQ